MKTRCLKRRQERGSVMLLACGFLVCASILLSSYLFYVATQYRSVARAQVWNGAVPTMEAGVEEAMAHLNKNCISNGVTPIWSPTADGWALENAHQLTKAPSSGNSCYLADGSYYTVTISNWDSPMIGGVQCLPEINVTATVPAPAYGSATQIQPIFAAATVQAQATVSRKVKVTTQANYYHVYALAAKGTIDLNGNNIKTDSYDSSDPNYSNNGQYDSSKTKANGDIATNTNINNALDIGNANVKGSVHSGTGSTSSAISVGANGSVGDSSWVNGGNTGVQTNHSTTDMNEYFPDVTAPFTSGSDPLRNVAVSTTNVSTNLTLISTVTPPSTPPSATTNIVVTNWTQVSSTTYPTESPITGLSTNTASTSSSTYPTSGTYVGTVTTNTTYLTTNSAPASGTYIGSVTTAPLYTTNTTAPGGGTSYTIIYGSPLTSFNNKSTVPSVGVTNVVQRVNGKYDYDQMTPYYVYQSGTGYAYSKITGYTYTSITSYTYTKVSSYSVYAYTRTTNVTSTTYDMVFTAPGDYSVSSLSGKILVRGSGNCRIYDSGNFSLSGQDSFTISAGCTVQVYVAGSSTDIGGNGVVNNNGTPSSFQYYGLPTNTSVSMHGNFAFTGTVYAPSADLSLSGGGNDNFDVAGAIICKTATLNGHANLHYDEALAKSGNPSSYMVGHWAEQ